MLVSTLLNQIKREGEFEASTDYDAMLIDIINEYFTEAVKRTNLREYLKINQSLTLTAATQAVSLPSGFLRLSEPRAYYIVSGETNRRLLRPATLRLCRDFDGQPSWFSINLNQFNVFPYHNIGTGDTVIMNYYSGITVLTSGSTLPDNFDNVCKHGALSRLLNLKDSKRAQLHAGLFKDAMTGLIANGAVN